MQQPMQNNMHATIFIAISNMQHEPASFNSSAIFTPPRVLQTSVLHHPKVPVFFIVHEFVVIFLWYLKVQNITHEFVVLDETMQITELKFTTLTTISLLSQLITG